MVINIFTKFKVEILTRFEDNIFQNVVPTLQYKYGKK